MTGQQRAQQDLALIRQLMLDSRREVVDRGKHFIIWGLVPAIGALLTYAYARGATLPHPTLVWGALLVVGWLASFTVGWRDSRQARVSTTARRLLSGLWISAAVSLTLLGVAGMFGGALDHNALPGVLSAVIAAPVLMTMLLTGERWLGLVALGWWAGGALMLFVPGQYTLLVLAVMSFLLLAVPGMVLNAKARQRAQVPDGGPAADVP